MKEAYLCEGHLFMSFQEVIAYIREGFDVCMYGSNGAHNYAIIDGVVNEEKNWFITKDRRALPLKYEEEYGLFVLDKGEAI